MNILPACLGGGVTCQVPTQHPFPCTRPPGSWNLEELKALGPLATYISPHLWEKVQEVGGKLEWAPGP